MCEGMGNEPVDEVVGSSPAAERVGDSEEEGPMSSLVNIYNINHKEREPACEAKEPAVMDS
jgi:hypothetical protein